jgi:hypothetical protein
MAAKGRRPLEPLASHGVPRHHVETGSILSDPFLEAIGIKLLDVLRNLGQPQVPSILIGGVARHLCHESRRRRDLEIGQRCPLSIEVV